MALMNTMLRDCTDMTEADNGHNTILAINNSQYNRTFSGNYLEEISPQSKALCQGDWGASPTSTDVLHLPCLQLSPFTVSCLHEIPFQK